MFRYSRVQSKKKLMIISITSVYRLRAVCPEVTTKRVLYTYIILLDFTKPMHARVLYNFYILFLRLYLLRIVLPMGKKSFRFISRYSRVR